MAIRGLRDLSNLSLGQLYAVYVGVAQADWNWRCRAAHGTAVPPPGRSGFRPLPFAVFEHRVQAARAMAHGDRTLRNRLARQAAAYRVDVEALIAQTAQAA